MKPDWYKLSAANHAEFLKRARFKGRLLTEEDVLRFLALATAGEAGELGNLYKKEWRGDTISPEEFADKVKAECADIYTYLRHIAHHAGFDLDAAAAEKAQEVAQRLAA